jgi:hypothetical protein
MFMVTAQKECLWSRPKRNVYGYDLNRQAGSPTQLILHHHFVHWLKVSSSENGFTSTNSSRMVYDTVLFNIDYFYIKSNCICSEQIYEEKTRESWPWDPLLFVA